MVWNMEQDVLTNPRVLQHTIFLIRPHQRQRTFLKNASEKLQSMPISAEIHAKQPAKMHITRYQHAMKDAALHRAYRHPEK